MNIYFLSIRINPVDFYPVFLYGFNKLSAGNVPALPMVGVGWNGDPGGRIMGDFASAVGFTARPVGAGTSVAVGKGAGPF